MMEIDEGECLICRAWTIEGKEYYVYMNEQDAISGKSVGVFCETCFGEYQNSDYVIVLNTLHLFYQEFFHKSSNYQ